MSQSNFLIHISKYNQVAKVLARPRGGETRKRSCLNKLSSDEKAASSKNRKLRKDMLEYNISILISKKW